MGKEFQRKLALRKEKEARGSGARSVLPAAAAPHKKRRKGHKKKKNSQRTVKKTRMENRTRVSLVFQEYEEVFFSAGSIRREQWYGEAAMIRREQREAGVIVPEGRGLREEDIWVDMDQIVRVYNGPPDLSDYEVEVEVEVTDSEKEDEEMDIVVAGGPECGKGDERDDEDMGGMDSAVAGGGWHMTLSIR